MGQPIHVEDGNGPVQTHRLPCVLRGIVRCAEAEEDRDEVALRGRGEEECGGADEKANQRRRERAANQEADERVAATVHACIIRLRLRGDGDFVGVPEQLRPLHCRPHAGHAGAGRDEHVRRGKADGWKVLGHGALHVGEQALPLRDIQ